jgi:hypothetical protein
MTRQLSEDVAHAANITWQQGLIAAGKPVPEEILDKDWLTTARGKMALSLLKTAGVNPKSPWAQPLWDLRQALDAAEPGRASRPPPKPRAAKKTSAKPAKKASKKVTARGSAPKGDGFIEKIVRQNRSIVVTVATDEKTVGKWNARGDAQMRAVLKKALAQAHLLAKRGYETCIVVIHESGATTVQCWPE